MGRKRIPVTNALIVEVLKAALKKMNNKGEHWIQNKFHMRKYFYRSRQHEDCYCAIGAIDAVLDEMKPYNHDEVREAVIRELAYGLQGSTIDQQSRVTSWNDNPRRKWPDVVERFKKQIDRVKKRKS